MPLEVAEPPYTVVVRNSSLQRIGKIDRLASLTVTPRFNAIGTWDLVIPLGSAQAALFTETGGVVFYYGDLDGPVLMSGPITGLRERWGDGDEGEGTLTVTGISDDVVIFRRLAWPNPGSAIGSQTVNEYDRRSGVGETIIKAYVNLNAGPGALSTPTDRRIPGLTIETDALRGSTVKGSARMHNLAELITPLALSAGLGWRVVQSGSNLQFQCFVPTDRTATARFARELGNLIEFDRIREAPKSTRPVVGGGGDGTARVFRQSVIDSTAETAWNLSAEVFIDARDTTDTVEMDQRAAEENVTNGPVSGLSITTMDIPNLKFGEHYGLGDKVTVEPSAAVKIADVLREVSIRWAAGAEGPETKSAVGTANVTGTPRMIRALQKLTAQVAALQAKK